MTGQTSEHDEQGGTSGMSAQDWMSLTGIFDGRFICSLFILSDVYVISFSFPK